MKRGHPALPATVVIAALAAALLAAPHAAEAATGPLMLLYANTSTPCGGPLAPGLNGTLIATLAYLGPGPALYVSAEPLAPPGLHVEPAAEHAGPGILAGDTVTLRFNVSASPALQPGTYSITLRLRVAYLYGGEAEQNITIPVHVAPCPRRGVSLEARIEPFSYPGTSGARLVLTIRNNGPGNLTNASLKIRLPSGWRPEKKTLDIGTLSENQSRTLTVTGVFIPLTARPGTYEAEANLTYTCSICGHRVNTTLHLRIPLRVEKPPEPRLAVLHAGWSDGYAYPGEHGTPLTLTVQLLEPRRVTGVNYTLRLPSWLHPSPGSTTAGFTATTLGYGSTLTIAKRVDVDEGARPGACGTLEARLMLRVEENGTTTWLPAVIEERLCLSKPRAGLTPASWQWSTWVAGPRGYGLEARLTLLHSGPDTLRWVAYNATAEPPAGIRGGYYASRAEAENTGTYGLARLTIPGITVPRGLERVTLHVEGVAAYTTPGGGTYTAPLNLTITLPVPRENQVLAVTQAYTTPWRLVRGMGRATLHVTLVNNGTAPLTVYNASLQGLPRGVEQVSATGTCLGTVAPGSTCTLDIALNITSRAEAGTAHPVLVVGYSYRQQGGLVTATAEAPLELRIQDPRSLAQRLVLVAAEWSNPATGQPVTVLPGDHGAPLRVTIYNPGPWTATAVTIRVEGGGWSSTTATCAAITAQQACTATLYVDVPNETAAKPSLVAEYTVAPQGAAVRLTQRWSIQPRLEEPRGAVTPVAAWWTTPPERGSRSAALAVAVATDPSKAASIEWLRLMLPSGLEAPEGGDTVTLHPQRGATQLQGLAALAHAANINPGLLEALTRQAAGAAGGAGVYEARVAVTRPSGRGGTGLLIAAWRDPLGALHVTTEPIHIPPWGSPGLLVAWAEPRAPMRGGIANITIIVRNEGSAPAYNIYAYLAPTGAAAAPVTPVKHIPALEPGEEARLTYTLAYNPAGFAGSKTYTFTGVLALVYDDPSTGRRYANYTVAAILEPPVRLTIRSLEAVAEPGKLVVKAVVVNTGLETAESVQAVVRAGNHTATYFLGSIDPGSETPFRVTIPGAAPGTVNVTITYMDQYGYTYSLTASTQAKPAPPPPETATARQKPGQAAPGAWARSAAPGAAAALAAAAALLWLRRRRGGEEQLPEELE